MLSNFLFSKPKNVGNAKCRPSFDRVSTNYWPIHLSSIDQLSISEVSAKCRQNVDPLSTDYRPLYWPSVDRVSTDYQPTIDRVSTAISTDILVDITHSKQDPTFQIRINKYAEDWGEECVTLAMVMKFACFVFVFFTVYRASDVSRGRGAAKFR